MITVQEKLGLSFEMLYYTTLIHYLSLFLSIYLFIKLFIKLSIFIYLCIYRTYPQQTKICDLQANIITSFSLYLPFTSSPLYPSYFTLPLCYSPFPRTLRPSPPSPLFISPSLSLPFLPLLSVSILILVHESSTTSSPSPLPPFLLLSFPFLLPLPPFLMLFAPSSYLCLPVKW